MNRLIVRVATAAAALTIAPFPPSLLAHADACDNAAYVRTDWGYAAWSPTTTKQRVPR